MAIESVESQTSITDRTPVLAKGRGKSGMLLHKGALITPMCTPIDATGFWACQAWGIAPRGVCRTIEHFSACLAFVCHWCLLPWSIRDA